MVSTIPFELNFDNSVSSNMSYVFNYATKLKEIPKIVNCKPSTMSYMFSSCRNIRYFPDDLETWFDWSYIDSVATTYTGVINNLFAYCYSLRKLPTELFQHDNKYLTSSTYLNLMYLYALDEMTDLPLPHINAWTSNCLNSLASCCYRLKNLTFALSDGAPYVKEWTKQTIDLTDAGYCGIFTYLILDYNSGITADKQVTDDATYQALKDDPDWFTADVAYSRYNHDSAVATINSLPDTSVYLATTGGANTIKFTGASGSATDGGAINTLTAEEIAVATAKGWTVSLV